MILQGEVEQGEHQRGHAQAECHLLRHVLQLVVADLMREHRDDFILRVVGDEGVKQRDALGLAEAGEEGVGLGAAAGAIDNADVLHAGT